MGHTYITGDIHGWRDIAKIKKINTKELGLVSKSDYLIILGDTQFLWDNSKMANSLINYMNNKPYTTLFIDGNHENFDNLFKKPIVKKFGGYVRKVSNSIFYLQRGCIYNINKKTIYTFGGAVSIDAYNRVPGMNWWKEESPTESEIKSGRRRINKKDNHIDYILTHDCSKPTRVKMDTDNKFKDTDDLLFQKHLLYLEDNVDFKHWYFGHYHLDKEIDEKHTVLYNNIIKLR